MLAGLVVALFSLVTAPAGAAPVESTGALRAKRVVLVARIAALSDQADRALAVAADADHRRQLSRAALQVTRARFARHAVDAYVGAVQDSEDRQLRRKVWAGSLSTTDRRVLGELRRAMTRAQKQERAAVAAIRTVQRTRARLEAARVALEQTIAERVRYEQAQSAAAVRLRTLAMVSKAAYSPRHIRATEQQAELMRRYRFGPGGIPAGLVATGHVLEGKASWYGPGFDGRATASGAIFDQEGWTVANRTLPLGTILLISRNDQSVVVLVNDRGPFVNGRILDLSHGVANALGTIHAGVAPVRAEILVPE